MAKTVTISQAEYEYMKTVIAHDGMTIARLEVELAHAKEDIRRVLIVSPTGWTCAFCKAFSRDKECENCELEAEWRGYRSDVQT